MRFRVFTLTLAVILAVVVARGAASVDVEAEAHAIEAMLIAPCCFSQQVSVHHSPAADEVRADIRRRLAAGETREQILDAYVAQYGKRILAQPPAEGVGWLLYITPPLALVFTLGLLWYLVRHMTKREPSARLASGTTASVGPHGYAATLEQELRDLD